jgi:cell pole-organizing protein PopZ
MEEILASIRRIIADDDTGKPPPKVPEVPPPPVAVRSEPPPPPPRPEPAPPAPEPAMRQDDIDAMLSSLNKSAPPPEPPAPDILELTESMATAEPEPAEAAFRTIDGQPDVVFDERPFEPAPPPRRAPMMDADALLSASTTSAVDSAFNTLAHTVLVQNARTLEDLVKEMLRPMLKGWLDDNLPGLVERLVRAEIERVSRGRT